MRIEITAGGIYDGAGKEVPIGSTFDVKEEPTGWAGRYRIVSSGNAKGKDAVTNPKAKGKDADVSIKAEHHGGGKFNVTQGETVLLSGLSKADADAFNGMSDEDKKAYVEATKAGE